MEWVKFERVDQLGEFSAACEELNRPLLERLNRVERPFFFNYWSKLLNLSDCYLLKRAHECVALATYIRIRDTHFARWQMNTLSVRPGFRGPFHLPRSQTEPESDGRAPLGGRQFFATPSLGASRDAHFEIEGCQLDTVQIAYARKLQGLDLEDRPDLELHALDPGAIEGVKRVFLARQKGEAGQFYLEYYLPLLLEGVERSLHSQCGWCFYATLKGSGEPMAAVYYTGWELPLSGTWCALVDDLVVLPQHRGRGVASALQAWAYSRLRQAGIGWVCGNIGLENTASLAQARKLERSPWTLQVRVTPAA